ncbi:MAG TPA: carboxypeptidase regulatory-like domain-containing protein [Polyangiaceae bacterium]|nr:carboxypeptidase regulatory-like domain-containing protein [Polyangiaceae bacterium]
MMAHVFHFPYSTTDVTGLDGRYEISGVPVGKAKVNVFLPQTKTMLSESKEIEVKPGVNTLDLTLTFDAERDTPEDGHGGTKPKYRDPNDPLLKMRPDGSATPSATPTTSATAAPDGGPL